MTFRCESCGYDLSQTPIDDVCPECGVAVADSIDANKPGTPWQRRHSPRSLAAEIILAATGGKRIYRDLAIGRDNGSLAGFLYLALIAAIALSGFSIPLMRTAFGIPVRGMYQGGAMFSVSLLIGVTIEILIATAIANVATIKLDLHARRIVATYALAAWIAAFTLHGVGSMLIFIGAYVIEMHNGFTFAIVWAFYLYGMILGGLLWHILLLIRGQIAMRRRNPPGVEPTQNAATSTP